MNASIRRVPYYLIVGFKGLKGVLLLLLAAGLYTAVTKFLPRDVRGLLDRGFLGAEWEFFDNLARNLGGGERGGALVGGILFALEVFGLVRGIRWLVWLAVAESAFFAAVGVFQLTRGFDLTTAALVVINGLIAWHLARGGGGGGGAKRSGGAKPAKPRKPAK